MTDFSSQTDSRTNPSSPRGPTPAQGAAQQGVFGRDPDPFEGLVGSELRTESPDEQILSQLPRLNADLVRAQSLFEIVRAYHREGVDFSDGTTFLKALRSEWQKTTTLCVNAAKAVEGQVGIPRRTVRQGEISFDLVGEIHSRGIPDRQFEVYRDYFDSQLVQAKNLLLEDGISKERFPSAVSLKDRSEIPFHKMLFLIGEASCEWLKLKIDRLFSSVSANKNSESKDANVAELVDSLLIPDGRPRADVPLQVYSGEYGLPASLLMDFMQHSNFEWAADSKLHCSLGRSIYMTEFLREFAVQTGESEITFRSGLSHTHHLETMLKLPCLDQRVRENAIRDCREVLQARGVGRSEESGPSTSTVLGVTALTAGLLSFPVPVGAGLLVAAEIGYLIVLDADQKVSAALVKYVGAQLEKINSELQIAAS